MIIDLSKLKKDEFFSKKFEIKKDEEFKLIGQGEYNINYIFYSKVHEQNLVLRISTDSQMNLDNQIEYEYRALELLEKTNRTPKAIYFDESKKMLSYGFLVMEYLPGRALDYKKDLKISAEILADIHSECISKNNHLLSPEDPIRSIYEECLDMFRKYKNSKYKNIETEKQIDRLLEKAKQIRTEDVGKKTIINTELNSGNFLINGEGKRNYLIDWEKPLYGYPAQDLGHFLAPTTTFWKTDVILSKDEIDFFLKEYCKKYRHDLEEVQFKKSVKDYLSINCLRGITWCAMAYIEYQNPDRLIKNEDTYKKIKTYLSKEFLNMIEKEYLNEY